MAAPQIAQEAAVGDEVSLVDSENEELVSS